MTVRLRPLIKPDVQISLSGSEVEPPYVVLIINASDFQTDLCHLTGRTGLLGRLSLTLAFVHRPGSPRLYNACLTDVLTTLTPTEFTEVEAEAQTAAMRAIELLRGFRGHKRLAICLRCWTT